MYTHYKAKITATGQVLSGPISPEGLLPLMQHRPDRLKSVHQGRKSSADVLRDYQHWLSGGLELIPPTFHAVPITAEAFARLKTKAQTRPRPQAQAQEQPR